MNEYKNDYSRSSINDIISGRKELEKDEKKKENQDANSDKSPVLRRKSKILELKLYK